MNLIAGERRWRAVKQFTSLPTIAAQVLTVNDLQARRLCATENIQRADLTPLEEIKALAELVDASLLLEYGDEYEHLSPSQEPRWRVKMLLTKLESDRRNKTDYFTGKFSGKVLEIFSGLPKPKELASFLDKDLPLLFTDEEVQQFALDQKLNKSQTRAIDGRNRLAACKLAGITPSYRIVDADAEKLKSLVWSWNGPRRHLTSSQKAMAYAMMYPDAKHGGNRKSDQVDKNQLDKPDLDKATISRARFILKHDKEKADLVRDGHPDYPLSKTYEAEQRKHLALFRRLS